MYSVSVRKQMDLDFDEAGSLVGQVLQGDFDFLCREINELRANSNLKAFEADDLKRNLEVRDAIKTLLQYYLTKTEYDQFMELQRCYGNV